MNETLQSFIFPPTERPVGGSEVITDLLQQLGSKQKDVKFIFRHNSPPSGEIQQNGKALH